LISDFYTVLFSHWSLLFSLSPPRLLTKTEHHVNIHPKSVNADERFFPSAWFVYHLKLKTRQVCFHTYIQSHQAKCMQKTRYKPIWTCHPHLI